MSPHRPTESGFSNDQVGNTFVVLCGIELDGDLSAALFAPLNNGHIGPEEFTQPLFFLFNVGSASIIWLRFAFG